MPLKWNWTKSEYWSSVQHWNIKWRKKFHYILYSIRLILSTLTFSWQYCLRDLLLSTKRQSAFNTEFSVPNIEIFNDRRKSDNDLKHCRLKPIRFSHVFTHRISVIYDVSIYLGLSCLCDSVGMLFTLFIISSTSFVASSRCFIGYIYRL